VEQTSTLAGALSPSILATCDCNRATSWGGETGMVIALLALGVRMNTVRPYRRECKSGCKKLLARQALINGRARRGAMGVSGCCAVRCGNGLVRADAYNCR
jgi:hypothetical protein